MSAGVAALLPALFVAGLAVMIGVSAVLFFLVIQLVILVLVGVQRIYLTVSARNHTHGGTNA